MVRRSLPLLVAFTLVACAPVTAVKPKTGKPPAEQPTTTAARPTPAPPAFLGKPSTPVRVVSGVLQLESGYVTATGAGSIISGNGSTALGMGHLTVDASGALISNDGGGLISNDGGGLISNDGGGIVSPNGGTIVSPNGGTIVSPNGGTIVSPNGGTIVSPNGGTIVSPNGGTIVASGGGNVIAPNGGTVIAPNGGGILAPNGGTIIAGNGSAVISGNGSTIVASGGGNYHLTATTPELAPAAGMLLQAVRLGVDQPLPLGVDKDGHPVYAIYTNGGGHFEIYLPATETGNIHLRAVAPNLDGRLIYDHVGSPAAGQEVAIDEDTAQVSRYLLVAFRSKLAKILAAPNIDDKAFQDSVLAGTNVTPAVANFLWPVAHTFIDHVKAAGIPPARYEEAAGKAAEALIGTVKLEDLPVDTVNTNWKHGPAGEKALDALKVVFKQTREQVARLGGPDQVEAFFAKQGYMDYANTHLKPGRQPYRIRKHSDVGDFMVAEYLSSLNQDDLQRATDVFYSLLPPGESLDPNALALDHLYAAASGVGLQLVVTFVQDEAAQAAVFAAIDAMKTKP